MSKSIKDHTISNPVTIYFKRLTPTAKLPSRVRESDAGWDLYADEECVLSPGEIVTVRLGVISAIPIGYYMELHDHSSMALKGISGLAGIINAEDRGEWQAVFTNHTESFHVISKGDKVIQAILKQVIPSAIFEVIKSDLPSSSRGTGGFGSTGK